MNHRNKNRMLAGVLAMLFVLQAGTIGVTAFADDASEVVMTDTAPSPDDNVLPGDYTSPTETTEDVLTLSGAFTMPDLINEGTDVDIQGAVKSNVSAISSLSVGVYSTTGGLITGTTVTPNADFFDLHDLDGMVNFTSLTPGTYTFIVSASNAEVKDVRLMVKQFEVKKNAADPTFDRIEISGASTLPESIKAGESFSVRGVVTSGLSNLEAVSVAIYTETLERVTGATVRPDAKTYDLSKLDNLIAFSTLSEGRYIYRITATNGSNTNFVVEETYFNVTAGTQPVQTSDTLTAEGITAIPETIKQGSVLNIKGTVTSASSDITYLICGIYDMSGKFISGRMLSPKTKSFDLSRLDRYVAFDKLPAGEYAFAVLATNASNSNAALVNTKFTVTASGQPGTPSAKDQITISGMTQIPDHLQKGAVLSVRGIVTSANSDMTSVTAAVYDNAGNFVTGKTASIRRRDYWISNLDQYLMFNKLNDGAYTFKVIATNASIAGVTVYEKAFTVGTGQIAAPVDATQDTMCVAGMFQMPDSIQRGQTVSVIGIAYSKLSDFKALTVGVYDTAGKFRTGKTINPAADFYDLQNLDRYVTFNSLPDGEYIFAVIASNASRTNEALYTKKFTVGTGIAPGLSEDTMKLTNLFTLPGSIKPGSAVNVTGTVSSAVSDLTTVTAGVYDFNNNLVTGKTVTVNAKTFDLKTLDNDIAFNKLAAGVDYTFRVYASNGTKNNEQLISQRFVVTDGSAPSSGITDTLTLTGGSKIPDTIKLGQAVSVTGTVTSASSEMTALTCGVYNSAGQFVTGRTINPKSKTYDLKNLDAAVEFNHLNLGSYTYAIIASNAANKNYTVLSKKFTVTDENGSATPVDTGAHSSLYLTGGTVVPSTLAVGQALNVKGTVYSATEMTALTVGVYDKSGKFCTGKTINPKAKTYDLANLDSAVEFNKLPEGSYVYAVIASNATETNYAIVNKSFTIGGSVTPGSSIGTDSLMITGGTTIPATLAQGRPLNVFGTVTSGSSLISALTVGVYDSNGRLVTGRTINPNARSYDLKKLDAYVSFNTLPVGNYTYAVTATNASRVNSVLTHQAFSVYNNPITPSSDQITAQGVTTVPSQLGRGRGVSVRGTVYSSSSLLTYVTVGVYNASGVLVTGRTVTPGAYSYNLHDVDSFILFDQLTAGSYTFIVRASNGSQSNYTVTNQAFTVV